MIGIQSSIIMFPINLLIVSIFRNARPREQKSESSSKQQSKIDPKKQGKTRRVSPNQPPHNHHKEITPDTVIKASPSLRVWPKIVTSLCHNGEVLWTFMNYYELLFFQDVKRIAQSLYKVMRRPVPRIELDSTKTNINNLLSLVEEIIRQHNRIGNEFYTDSSKKEQTFAASLDCVNLKGGPTDMDNSELHSYFKITLERLVGLELINLNSGRSVLWHNIQDSGTKAMFHCVFSSGSGRTWVLVALNDWNALRLGSGNFQLEYSHFQHWKESIFAKDYDYKYIIILCVCVCMCIYIYIYIYEAVILFCSNHREQFLWEPRAKWKTQRLQPVSLQTTAKCGERAETAGAFILL